MGYNITVVGKHAILRVTVVGILKEGVYKGNIRLRYLIVLLHNGFIQKNYWLSYCHLTFRKI